MKKLFTLLSLGILCLSLNAQTSTNQASSGHLAFKGVPIDGTLSEFTDAMVQRGFTVVEKTEGSNVLLTGPFAGYGNCEVLTFASPKRDLVYKIGVYFPARFDWNALKSDFYTLRSMMTAKYGNPNTSLEEFKDADPQDDAAKFNAVLAGKCNFTAVYFTKKGTIELLIMPKSAKKAIVALFYYDKTNGMVIQTLSTGDL